MAKTVQIRDVPDDIHQRLVARAAAERRSLSELLRAEVVELASRPPMAEMLDRLTSRPKLDVPESSAEALGQERAAADLRSLTTPAASLSPKCSAPNS